MQSTHRAATTPAREGENLAPVLNAEAAANRILTVAVESLLSKEQSPQRATPGGDQSDRFADADTAGKAGPDVGRFLNIVA